MDTSASPTKEIPVAILVRVSTVRQETARQISELRLYAASKGYRIVEVAEEVGISGRADASERSGLLRVRQLAEEGAIVKVLVHEISRLGRRPAIIQEFVERMTALKVSVYWHTTGLETLLPNGSRNPAAAIVLAVLAELALTESETLGIRIRSGLDEARRNGKRLGRKPGSGMSDAQFLAAHKDVVKLLRAGHSNRNAAAILAQGGKKGASLSTVKRVRALMGELPAAA